MKTTFLLLVLAVASATNILAQSGRRVTTPRTSPLPPVQAPLNPEPEVARPTGPTPVSLMFLPEKLFERRIRALDGNSFRLADFQGKVLVINLWASWCGPCRREVPEYEDVRKDYLGRDVEFIGLTPEDPAEASANVNNFVRSTRFGFLLGWADREMARTLMNGRQSIPQTMVIDAKGSIIAHWAGYARGRNGDRLREAIDNALK
jgi:thiol-disulfide isomerase/thioredoxin